MPALIQHEVWGPGDYKTSSWPYEKEKHLDYGLGKGGTIIMMNHDIIVKSPNILHFATSNKK